MQLMLLLLLAGPPAAAPFDVQVDPSGAVNATVNGVRCLEDFRVLIPAPDWKGGASPRDGIRQDLGPGHVRVSGTMVDQTPCARHDAEGADLAWEVTFTRDYAVETVRLNGLVACDLAAGKGAWLFHRPKKLTWGMLPARYGEPGGYLSDWGFDWFAWALPGGATLRLLPRDGLTGFYQQDGRQWGDARFQGCWVMREKGAVPAGTVLRAGIRLAPLSADELAAEATRAGCSLLAPTATLTPDADGRATWSLGLTSLWPRPRTIRLAWTARDDLGTPLARGQEGLAVAALGSAERRLAVPASPSGDYRLRAELHWSPAAPPEVIEQRQVLARPGPRARLSLDGTWETCPDAAGGDTPPAEAKWTAVQVPGWLPQPARHTWYRRSFDLPPALQGRRLKLCFGAVNHAARVYVNGRLAGSHVGADVPFELDVTDLVRPDANELAVAVTGWTAVCTNPPATFEVKQFEHPGWKIPPGTIIAPIGGDFRSTGIWQSVALEALPAVHLADVFVRTSVRQHRLRVTATVRNEGDGPVTVQLHSRIADAHGPAKELPDGEAALAPGETREVQLSAPWVNPHLWSLDEPHLYRLTTDLSVGGQHVDTLATRFGFREVWTAGSRVMLNGLPLTLFATSTWDAPSWEAARERMARFKAAGVRSVRLHTQPWQPHNLDVADELGLLIVDEAAVYCYAQSYAPTDERFWRAYTEHVQALARRDRNHPSLALYSLENEILSCGGKPAEWEPGLGKLADALRQVDPTRLIFCESDLDPAGKMDLYGMHYPREYWAGYTLYPRKCWWMGQPIDYLGRKWQWKRDKPLYIGEFDGGFPAWYPQYQAFWLGDEAYTSRGRFSVDSVNSRARREMIAQEIAAYRAYGVTGMNPWFDADEVDVFGPVAYAPLTLAVREQTTHFYAGDRVVRTVHVYNDTLRRTRLELRWHAGASTASGSETLDLSPGTVAERRLTFIAPRPRERWTVPFTVELREGARSVKTVKQPLGVYPRPSAPLDASGIGLWDPAGTSTKVLAAHGVAPRPAADPAALPAGLKVLLIGAGALRDGAAPWAASLARFVGEGGRVVCFEQTAYPQDWLPLPVELDAKHSASLAFARPKHHPVLEGVADEDLRFWQPDHLVSAHTLLKPNRGNFAVLVDAGGIRSAIDDLNGLNWAPLLELPFGQGRYLLCQLPLIARADVEPTAEILLRRLVVYAREAQEPEWAKVALVADPDSPLKRALDGLRVRYDLLPPGAALPAGGVLIVGGGPAAWRWLEDHAAALPTWAANGGRLWLDNVPPSEAGTLGAILGEPVTLRPAETVPVTLTRPDPLTTGLSNHELYWRDRPIWDQWTALRPVADWVPEGRTGALTDPPVLTRIPFDYAGRGGVVLNQMLWTTTEGDRLEAMRTASILLTNLGVPMDLSPFGSAAAREYRTVDLGPYATLGLEGDPETGWMGHGPRALAGLAHGRQVFRGVPFVLADPAAHGGKCVVALRGTARPNYPAEVTGIAVNGRARALHFLHTCAWAGAEGTPAARYEVHYADGTRQVIPVRVGLEVADWYVDPHPLPLAEVAWRGHVDDKPGEIGLHMLRWANPWPDKPITDVSVVSAGGAPVAVLMALTVEP